MCEAEEQGTLPEGTQRQQTDATVVRWRLTLCIFLYTIGSSVMAQVYPKVILLSFEGDDGEASKYRGWVAAGVSAVQLIFVPALSGVSDAVGRRAVIAGALALHGTCVFAFAASPTSLVWATACDLVTSLGVVIIPLSQAIMIDISADGGTNATHGLGMAFAAFSFATSVGDIVGGSLSEHHRMEACLLCGSLSVAALLSLVLFGWEETAPESIADDIGGVGGSAEQLLAATTDDNGTRQGRRVGEEGGSAGRGNRVEGKRKRRRPALSNPLSIVTVVVGSRVLLQVAFSYFLFVLSLNVFAIGYNYLDFRFHWSPLEISYFFATFNALMAIAGGWGLRGVVPKRLSEENGALLGILIQGCTCTLYGLCVRGWMLYPALAFGSIQNITEPCLQAIMATFVAVDRQGSLQGAVMSLRVIGEGVAGPLFTQIFSASSSAGFEEAPFFVAAIISVVGLTIAWRPLRKLDKARHTPGGRAAQTSNESRTGEEVPDGTGEGGNVSEPGGGDGGCAAAGLAASLGCCGIPVPSNDSDDDSDGGGGGGGNANATGVLKSDASREEGGAVEVEEGAGGEDELTRPLLASPSAPAWERC